jgi:tetratricopeptide (TPR) repeat protein
MELLWLLVVVLVPIIFLDRQYSISEAIIAYVEVPKVAMLRTLAGLIAILWLVEWGITVSTGPPETVAQRVRRFQPSQSIPVLSGWLRGQPAHWLMLSVWFYLGTTLLGTLFSASFSVSLWGEVPGQDGYSAYSIVAYVLLFWVIATHLKTRSQLLRLMGAIVTMGILISGLAVLQAYGHDFRGLYDEAGGGITSTFGNRIFAGAVMLMTIPISLVTATIFLGAGDDTSRGASHRLKPWLVGLLVSAVWVAILIVQLLGITFTLSRGPWIGTLFALFITLGLTTLFVGWSGLSRAALLLGIASGAALTIVQWGIPISSVRLWLSIALALVVMATLQNVLGWRTLGRLCLVAGVCATVAAAGVLMPSWFNGGLGTVDSRPVTSAETPAFGDTAVAQRFSSISGYVSTGFFSGRGDTWQRSWELIRNRPWFEFDDLSLPWIRTLLGYGPDLFRYTYLLKSVPQGGNVPIEPDHAHNYFVNQAVDLGVLGFLSSLGIFAAVFLVGGYLLIWERNGVSPLLTLILIGVLATLAGRFLEMMIGVARVSDLTVLWVLLGILAALPGLMKRSKEESHPLTPSGASRRSMPVKITANKSQFQFNLPHFVRLAIITWLIGAISILIWVKNVNYVRASVEVGEAVEYYRTGDFQASLTSLDKAIELAPDVSSYYNYRAQVYFAYHLFDQVAPERECTLQNTIPYGGCLNIKAFESNFEGARQRPFYYRSRWALANSALNLKQDAIAIRLYGEVLSMVPNSRPMRTDIGSTYLELAQLYLDADRPKAALKPLEAALAIKGEQGLTSRAYLLAGIAYNALDRLSEAAESIENGLKLRLPEALKLQAHQTLVEVYGKLGQTNLAEEHRRLATP